MSGEIIKSNAEGDSDSNSDDDDWSFCRYCNTHYKSIQSYNMHLRGFGHIQNVNKKKKAPSSAKNNASGLSTPVSDVGRNIKAVNTTMSSSGQSTSTSDASDNNSANKTSTNVSGAMPTSITTSIFTSSAQQNTGVRKSRFSDAVSNASVSSATSGKTAGTFSSTSSSHHKNFPKPQIKSLMAPPPVTSAPVSEMKALMSTAPVSTSVPSSEVRPLMNTASVKTSVPASEVRPLMNTVSTTSTAVPVVTPAKHKEVYCNVCDKTFSNEAAFNIHTRGLGHTQKLQGVSMSKRMQSPMGVPPAKKLKQWEAAWEKSYTPSDFVDNSSNPNAQFFYCEVCCITCTGTVSFDAHVDGKAHKKKLKRLQDDGEMTDGGAAFGAGRAGGFKTASGSGGGGGARAGGEWGGGPVTGSGSVQAFGKGVKRTSIQRELDNCREPLLGLDYMTEYQKLDPSEEPRFVCDLCSSKMDPRQVVAHVTGSKHRMRYFKHHAVNFYNTLYYAGKPDKNAMMLRMAQDVEGREKRFSVRLQVETDPFSSGPRWKEIESGRVRDKKELPGFKDPTAQYEQEEAPRHHAADGYAAMSFRGRPQIPARQHPPSQPPLPPAVPPYRPPPPEPSLTAQRRSSLGFPTSVGKSGKSGLAIPPGMTKQILESLLECEVKSDKDAEVALQISNALTQALLNFRMKAVIGVARMNKGAGSSIHDHLKALQSQAKNIERARADSSESRMSAYPAASAASPYERHMPSGDLRRSHDLDYPPRAGYGHDNPHYPREYAKGDYTRAEDPRDRLEPWPDHRRRERPMDDMDPWPDHRRRERPMDDLDPWPDHRRRERPMDDLDPWPDHRRREGPMDDLDPWPEYRRRERPMDDLDPWSADRSESYPDREGLPRERRGLLPRPIADTEHYAPGRSLLPTPGTDTEYPAIKKSLLPTPSTGTDRYAAAQKALDIPIPDADLLAAVIKDLLPATGNSTDTYSKPTGGLLPSAGPAGDPYARKSLLPTPSAASDHSAPAKNLWQTPDPADRAAERATHRQPFANRYPVSSAAGAMKPAAGGAQSTVAGEALIPSSMLDLIKAKPEKENSADEAKTNRDDASAVTSQPSSTVTATEAAGLDEPSSTELLAAIEKALVDSLLPSSSRDHAKSDADKKQPVTSSAAVSVADSNASDQKNRGSGPPATERAAFNNTGQHELTATSSGSLSERAERGGDGGRASSRDRYSDRSRSEQRYETGAANASCIRSDEKKQSIRESFDRDLYHHPDTKPANEIQGREPFNQRDSEPRSRRPYNQRDSEPRSREPYNQRDSEPRSRVPYNQRDSEPRSREPYSQLDRELRGSDPYSQRDRELRGSDPYSQRDRELRGSDPYSQRDRELRGSDPYSQRDRELRGSEPYDPFERKQEPFYNTERQPQSSATRDSHHEHSRDPYDRRSSPASPPRRVRVPEPEYDRSSLWEYDDPTPPAKQTHQQDHDMPGRAHAAGDRTSSRDLVDTDSSTLVSLQGLTNVEALQQAEGLLANLAHVDVNSLSATEAEELQMVLETISGINSDLARGIPTEALSVVAASMPPPGLPTPAPPPDGHDDSPIRGSFSARYFSQRR